MSDRIDQEQVQPSFPSASIPEFSQEETITNLPSFIDSLSNNNDNNSSSLMNSTKSLFSAMPTNDETNSSAPKTKRVKTRSRKTNSSLCHPVRNKISKDSSKGGPYTIPYSTRSQTQLRQQASSLEETTSTSTTVNTVDLTQSQVPTTGRKKYCAKCKESLNTAKIINSKMSRIEELVNELKKVTDRLGHGVGTNVSQPLSSYGGIDFSKMNIDDLQSFVLIITNAIMTAASTNAKSANNSNLSTVKLEFEESQSHQLKVETPQ